MQSVTVSTSVNPLSPVALANMTYTSTVTASGVATLIDGSYTEQAAPGSVSLNGVVLLPSPMAFGELDGQQSAAVLVAEGGGGSGSFISLHVVQIVDGAPTDMASTELGDRIHVDSLNIADNQITVDMITHGSSDPACCPTQPVVRVYELQDGQLVMVSETKTGTAQAAGDDALAGTTWTWTGTLMNDGSERLPAEGVSFQLAFGTDGSLSATTDCNTFMGTYTLGADSQITIGLPASTMMACPDGAQQDAYIQDLTSIQFYLLRDGNLHLQLPFDSGTMNFAPAAEGPSAEATPAATEATATEATPEATEAVLPQPAPLPGTVWLWTGNVLNDGSRVDPVEPDAFQLSFAEDSSVSATTDCNTFKGAYTTGEGGTVTIELPASTRMACPEGSQQDTYIRDLTSVQSYITQDGNLYLALPVDAGNMTYTPVAP
ncbi:MAG: META domain-containing protein [Anaerolineales bacterium]|nr:META domain-containing protein [Anaerolineales bacterium]